MAFLSLFTDCQTHNKASTHVYTHNNSRTHASTHIKRSGRLTSS